MMEKVSRKNWQEIPIKEIYLGLYDGPHATPKPASEGAIYLGIKNITEDGRIDLSQIRYISEEELPKWTRRVTPKTGDIVFTYEATLHRYAIIPKGFRGCLGRRLALLRPNTKKVNTRFLFYYFFGQNWYKTVAENIILGSTVERIPISDFPNFKVSLPPLPIQQKIAAILSAYDDLIENNTRRIEILEEMARMLYREWFVKFRYPGHESDRLVESELGLIPEDWEVKKLDEVGFIGRGKSKHRPRNDPSLYGGQYPFIQTGEVKSSLLYITNYKQSYNDKGLAQSKIWQSETLLITIAANIAETAIITMPACFPDSIVGFVADYSKVTPEFIKYRIDDLKLQMQNFSRGTAQDNLSLDKIKYFNFLIPQKKDIQTFEKYTKSIFKQIKNLQQKNNNLRQTRDLLLPRLISGEIDSGEIDVENLDIKTE